MPLATHGSACVRSLTTQGGSKPRKEKQQGIVIPSCSDQLDALDSSYSFYSEAEADFRSNSEYCMAIEVVVLPETNQGSFFHEGENHMRKRCYYSIDESDFRGGKRGKVCPVMTRTAQNDELVLDEFSSPAKNLPTAKERNRFSFEGKADFDHDDGRAFKRKCRIDNSPTHKQRHATVMYSPIRNSSFVRNGADSPLCTTTVSHLFKMPSGEKFQAKFGTKDSLQVSYPECNEQYLFLALHTIF